MGPMALHFSDWWLTKPRHHNLGASEKRRLVLGLSGIFRSGYPFGSGSGYWVLIKTVTARQWVMAVHIAPSVPLTVFCWGYVLLRVLEMSNWRQSDLLGAVRHLAVKRWRMEHSEWGRFERWSGRTDHSIVIFQVVSRPFSAGLFRFRISVFDSIQCDNINGELVYAYSLLSWSCYSVCSIIILEPRIAQQYLESHCTVYYKLR